MSSFSFQTLWKVLGGPKLTPEFRFHPERRWLFDFAIPSKKIALEIEGGIWRKGGGAHSRPKGILRDIEKYNAATLLGWRVFRFPAHKIKVADIEPVIRFVKSVDK